MGTTCTHKPKGMPVVKFLTEQGCFRWSDDNPYVYRVLDSALVNLREFYAAVEEVHKETGDRRVWAAVFKITLMRAPLSDPWDHNFCYKDMDESMGPYFYNCPERILKLLTPTEHEHARHWREECWKRINTKKARPKIQAGTNLLYSGRVYCAGESLGQRGWRVRALDTGLTYRMNRNQIAASEILCND